MVRRLLLLFAFLLCFQISFSQETADVNADGLTLEDIVSVYPNPVKDKLTVTNVLGSSYTMRVYNILGDTVLEQEIVNLKSKVDVSKLPSGVYIVAFYYDNETYTQRLVKE